MRKSVVQHTGDKEPFVPGSFVKRLLFEDGVIGRSGVSPGLLLLQMIRVPIAHLLPSHHVVLLTTAIEHLLSLNRNVLLSEVERVLHLMLGNHKFSLSIWCLIKSQAIRSLIVLHGI